MTNPITEKLEQIKTIIHNLNSMIKENPSFMLAIEKRLFINENTKIEQNEDGGLKINKKHIDKRDTYLIDGFTLVIDPESKEEPTIIMIMEPMVEVELRILYEIHRNKMSDEITH